jgi:hypothetical protein
VAFLLGKEVSFEDRDVRIAVQVRDAAGSSLVQATTITARLEPDSVLKMISPHGVTATCTVAGSTTDGICYFKFRVPSALFTHQSTITSSQQLSFSASCGLSPDKMQSLGKLVLLPKRAVPSLSVLNDIIMEVPQGAKYPGQRFTTAVSSRTTYQATTFTLIVTISDKLKYVGVNLAEPDRWSVTASVKGSDTISIVGLLKTGAPLDSTPIGKSEKLLDLVLAVQPAPPAGTVSGDISMVVELLSQHILGRVNIRNTVRQSGASAPSGSFIDHRGKLQQEAGQVRIKFDVTEGIFAVVHRTELVNTALFSGGGDYVKNRCERVPFVPTSCRSSFGVRCVLCNSVNSVMLVWIGWIGPNVERMRCELD